MPSIDINTILSAALATAVAEAVAPLVERIATLETRIAALENNPAIGVDTTLERRVAALEGSRQMSADAFVTHLDNQEWFWHKVAGFITNNSEITANDLEVLKDRVTALEGSAGLTRNDVEALIEQSMDNHLECYDHDNYDDIASKVDDMPDADDLVSKDDLSEAVRDAVSDLSFEISVR